MADYMLSLYALSFKHNEKQQIQIVFDQAVNVPIGTTFTPSGRR
jgi:hypothetical protein